MPNNFLLASHTVLACVYTLSRVRSCSFISFLDVLVSAFSMFLLQVTLDLSINVT